MESYDHQKRLLEGLDELRMEGYSTDVTLESSEGHHYDVHYIILKALGISDHLPPEQYGSRVRTGISSTALDIVICYIYRGILDLSLASDSTVKDINMFAEQYHIRSLQQILLGSALGKCITKTPTQDRTRLNKQHEPDERKAERKSYKDDHLVDPEKGTTENMDIRHVQKECLPSTSTKILLRAFLDKKGEMDEIHGRKVSPEQDTQKIVHAPKVICCDICGKMIAKKGFSAHKRIHNGIKNKTCEICGKQFRKACNLQEHWRRMHSSTKHHSCERCGATFTIKSDLRRHMARHQKTCFVCELCGASFVGKMMWKKHKCMDDIFDSDALDTVFGKDDAPNGQSSPHGEETGDDILNISTLIPLGAVPEVTGGTEILSEIDGLFYEHSVMQDEMQ